MNKNLTLTTAAVLLILLGAYMVYLGTNAKILPPTITGVGFIIIAIAFWGSEISNDCLVKPVYHHLLVIILHLLYNFHISGEIFVLIFDGENSPGIQFFDICCHF